MVVQVMLILKYYFLKDITPVTSIVAAKGVIWKEDIEYLS